MDRRRSLVCSARNLQTKYPPDALVLANHHADQLKAALNPLVLCLFRNRGHSTSRPLCTLTRHHTLTVVGLLSAKMAIDLTVMPCESIDPLSPGHVSSDPDERQLAPEPQQELQARRGNIPQMEPLPIPGLSIIRDFITPTHEASLISTFRALPWPSRAGGRLSLHWGYTFSYKTFGIDLSTPFRPFPFWLPALFPPTESRAPDQVCLQYYPPGTGIPPHADTHSVFDQLYALSLGAPVMMVFREGNVNEKVDVDLEPRGLIRLDGDARLHWSHGIRAKKRDTLPSGEVRERGERWSLTYRWLRRQGGGGEGEGETGPVCECGDVRLCDTAQSRQGVERELRWKIKEQAEAACKAEAQAEVEASMDVDQQEVTVGEER